MNLYEHEGKVLFAKMGIPVPRGIVVKSPEGVDEAAIEIGFPVVAKCQVLRGGRGKAGGIKSAINKTELDLLSTQLFGLNLGDECVQQLLIEEQLSIDRELYAGITFDPKSALPVLMVSGQGGVEIELVAAENPLALAKQILDPVQIYRPHHLMALAKQAGLTGPVMIKVAKVLGQLMACYFTYEAVTAEINPLVVLENGDIYAADAKIEIDDSAIYRQQEIKALKRPDHVGHPLEREAQVAGVSYVRLNETGNIGLICGGAGLGMATMDAVYHHGGIPANFLDLGHATPAKTAAALEIVLKTPGVEGVFVNAYGGMNNCGEIGEGISKVVDALRPRQAIVVKMRGHSQEEGWAMMAERNIPVIKYGTTGEGIHLLMQALKDPMEAVRGNSN